jgi:hypothetical protein
MRKALFGYWNALPGKIGTGAFAALGLAANLVPDVLISRFSSLMTVEDIRFWGVVAVALFFGYWLVWALLRTPETPDAPSMVTSGSRSPIVTGDNNHVGHNFINSPPKLTSTTIISTGPDDDFLAQFIDLGGLARLRLFMPYSDTMVTMILDSTPIRINPHADEGIIVHAAAVFHGGMQYIFNVTDNQRHMIEVGGAQFAVSLLEIDASLAKPVEGTLRYTFSVVER